MRCVDVNVLVDAHRPDAPNHTTVRTWLDAARRDAEVIGLPSVVASGFLRIVTHPRVFREPSPTSVGLDFIDALLRSPAVVRLEPGERHWSIFSELCHAQRLKGNEIPDAYLASIAIENGAGFVTSDQGFARFPGLRLEHPDAA